MVVVGDFGHGFINDSVRRVLEAKSKFLALNAQSNSSNMGYNYFTLYKRIDFLCANEEEVRMPFSMRFENIDAVIYTLKAKFRNTSFLVTRSKKGCVFVNDSGVFSAPVLTNSVNDTVGAGDALFAITSLFVYLKADHELIPFIANSAGGIAVNIMGNKESVSKDMMKNFINEVLK